jgi:hypothetical protein
VFAGKPDFVLIAGDILPKEGGCAMQRPFFTRLRRLLSALRDETGARVLLHFHDGEACPYLLAGFAARAAPSWPRIHLDAVRC